MNNSGTNTEPCGKSLALWYPSRHALPVRYFEIDWYTLALTTEPRPDPLQHFAIYSVSLFLV